MESNYDMASEFRYNDIGDLNESESLNESSLLETFKNRRNNLGDTKYSMNLDLSNINHQTQDSFKTAYSTLDPFMQSRKLDDSVMSRNLGDSLFHTGNFDPYKQITDSWLYRDMSPQNSPSLQQYDIKLKLQENYNRSPNFEASPNIPFTPFQNDIFNFDFPQNQDPKVGSSSFNSGVTTLPFSNLLQNSRQHLSSTVGYERSLSKTTNFRRDRKFSQNSQFSRTDTSVNLLKKLEGQAGRKKPYTSAIGAERSSLYEQQRRQESMHNAKQAINQQLDISDHNVPQESSEKLLERLYNMFYEKYTIRKNFKECQFCRRNGTSTIDHEMKDADGNVICPVLFRFVCKMCGATGSKAHTHKYCKNNHFTKGDPVAAGMPPGRPPVNSLKPKLTLDPKIDLNDIYRIRRGSSNTSRND